MGEPDRLSGVKNTLMTNQLIWNGNMNIARGITFVAVGLLLVSTSTGQSNAKDEKQTVEKKQKFSVADGWLTFEAPANWKKVPPKVNFIHADFTIPKTEGDVRDGRISFSHVGGSTEANLDRWIGQFKNVDPDDEKQVEKTTKKIDGQTVHFVRISGTFLDSAGGPFGPKTERENYLLIGAAVESEDGTNVYIKAYGPEKTMIANKKAIGELFEGMKATD